MIIYRLPNPRVSIDEARLALSRDPIVAGDRANEVLSLVLAASECAARTSLYVAPDLTRSIVRKIAEQAGAADRAGLLGAPYPESFFLAQIEDQDAMLIRVLHVPNPKSVRLWEFFAV